LRSFFVQTGILTALGCVVLTACGGGGASSSLPAASSIGSSGTPTANPTATPTPAAAGTATPTPVAGSTATPTPTAGGTATPTPVAGGTATPAPTAAPGQVVVTPAVLTFSAAVPAAAQTVSVLQPLNVGAFTVSACLPQSIATAPSSTTGALTITPVGAGVCKITVTGSGGSSATITVTVTTTDVVGS
jgi:hypothetical protein